MSQLPSRRAELFQNAENCAKCKADNAARPAVRPWVCESVCVWVVRCCTRFWLVLKAKSHLYSFEINLAFIQGARRETAAGDATSAATKAARRKLCSCSWSRGWRRIRSCSWSNIWRQRLAAAKQWINTCTWHTFRHNTRRAEQLACPGASLPSPSPSLIDKQLTSTLAAGPIETSTGLAGCGAIGVEACAFSTNFNKLIGNNKFTCKKVRRSHLELGPGIGYVWAKEGQVEGWGAVAKWAES